MQTYSRGSFNSHSCQPRTNILSSKLPDYINSEVFVSRGYGEKADSLHLYHPNAFVSAYKMTKNSDSRRLIQVSKRRVSKTNIIDQLSLKSKSNCLKYSYHLPPINLSRSRPLPPIIRTIQTHPIRNLHCLQTSATVSQHHLIKFQQPFLGLNEEISVDLMCRPKASGKKGKTKQCMVTKEGWNYQTKGDWLYKFNRAVL